MEEDFVKQLFDYVNQCVMYHVENADQMKRFLDFLAQMKSPLTVANKILIYGYDPKATEVRTREEWEKEGAKVLHPERELHNMKYMPGSKYEYVDRVMYDVTATDRKPQTYQPYKDAGAMAERLLMYPPCKVVFLEKAKAGKSKAEYIPEKNVIEVTRGFRDETEVCHYLLREFGHYFLKEKEELRAEKNGKEAKAGEEAGAKNGQVKYDRNAHGLEAQAVSYTVAVRYGIRSPTLENLQPYPRLQPKDLIRVFDGIDFAIGRITRQLENGPEQKRLAEQEAAKKKAAKKEPEEVKPKLREIPSPPSLGRE